MITFALAKGRLAEKTVDLLIKCNIDCINILEPTRKLELFDVSGEYRFIFVKPTDVPTYVEHGIADIGVCGKDTLLEADASILEMLDLGFSKCKLCIAGYTDDYPINTRVATKYVKFAKRVFAEKSMNVEIIKLNGSVELGPVLGLSDVIVDVVESGNTIKDNGLKVLEELEDSSARLIVNRTSLRLKQDKIKDLLSDIEAVL